MVDLSIIIPTFNRLWCLPQAVASCISDNVHYEIIVVDDGSTDGTWEWLRGQPLVTAIRQDNWGKDTAVNRGFSRAQGEYVRFLDSDDFLLPGANARQLALARSSNADVVVSGMRMLNESTKTEVDVPWILNDDFISQQIGESRSCHYSAFIFKRTFLLEIPHRQEFGVVDDRMFVIEVAINNPKVAVDDHLAFTQRDHSRNRLTNVRNINSLVGVWQHVRVYKKTCDLLASRGQLSHRRKRAIALIVWHSAHKMAAWSIADAIEIVDWIFQLDPDFCMPVRGVLGWSYKRFGFERTEQLIWVARRLRALIPRVKR